MGAPSHFHLINKYDEWCPNCGNPSSKLDNYTGWCSDCSRNDPYIQLENFLEENANHIEHFMAKGQTLSQALESIRNDYRPCCLSCGELMPRASKLATFCRKYERCRAIRNRYQYLHKKKNLTKSEALAKVIEQYNLQ